MGQITAIEGGVALYERMLVDVPSDAIRRTAVEDFAVPAEEFDGILQGFLQWIAAIPLKAPDTPYVMLKSDIDRVFHAFILNTREYREFCDNHLGQYVDHHPITGDGARPDVEATVKVLQHEYADQLSPYLELWARDLDADAWIVSCVQ